MFVRGLFCPKICPKAGSFCLKNFQKQSFINSQKNLKFSSARRSRDFRISWRLFLPPQAAGRKTRRSFSIGDLFLKAAA
jgi:hypothetical protein